MLKDSWLDGDRSAPRTPWGAAQQAYNIFPGVRWFSTSGHGGLMVSGPRATKDLTSAARKMGEFFGGAFWYEEDELWAIPYYEHPEWDQAEARISGRRSRAPDQMEQLVRTTLPEYFRLRESGFQLPAKATSGTKLQTTKTIKFKHSVMPAGTVVTVISSTGAYLLVEDVRGAQYRLPIRDYLEDGLVRTASFLLRRVVNKFLDPRAC